MNNNDLTFQDIYEEYHEKIRHYLKQMIGEADAEDVTQEVFVKIGKHLKTFRGGSKLSTWIYRIATNTALDKIRGKSFLQDKRTFSLSDSDASSDFDLSDQFPIEDKRALTTDEEVVKFEMNECIREYIDRLPPDYRTVVVLSELKDLKNQEIADILDISLDTMKIRLHRARAKLKQEFETGCNLYRDKDNELSCDRKSPES